MYLTIIFLMMYLVASNEMRLLSLKIFNEGQSNRCLIETYKERKKDTKKNLLNPRNTLKIYSIKCCYTKLIKSNSGSALRLMIIKNERKKEGFFNVFKRS